MKAVDDEGELLREEDVETDDTVVGEKKKR